MPGPAGSIGRAVVVVDLCDILGPVALASRWRSGSGCVWREGWKGEWGLAAGGREVEGGPSSTRSERPLHVRNRVRTDVTPAATLVGDSARIDEALSLLS
eukprot:scaffold49988_cov36-Tisochrysis_lutea.AAC.5